MGSESSRAASSSSFTNAAASSAAPAWPRRKRNSSSNWSTTTRMFSCSGTRASRTASVRPSVLRRSVASTRTRRMSARSSRAPRHSGKLKTAARWPIGSSPGRRTATRQPEPAPAMEPPCSAGIRPQRMREDLPLPEEPTTERKRAPRRRRSNSSICFSRPKKGGLRRARTDGDRGRGWTIPRSPSAARLLLRDVSQLPEEGAQGIRREAVELRNDRGFVRAELLLLRRCGGSQCNGYRAHGVGPAITRDLLDLAQLPAQPALVSGAVVDQHGVAGLETRFVVLADLGFIAFEYRGENFEPLVEEIVLPGSHRVVVPLVVDEIDLRQAGGLRIQDRLRRRRLEPGVNQRPQILERRFEQIRALLEARIRPQAFDDFALPLALTLHPGRDPHKACEIASLGAVRR